MVIKRNKPSWNKKEILAELNYQGNSDEGGIYRITNKTNNRQYIGSAVSFKNRWHSHISSLRNNKHSNKFLQNDYNKCGEAAYVFDIVEITIGTREERQTREQHYLDELFASLDKDDIYNGSKQAIISEPPKPKQRKYREDWYWFLNPEGIEYCVENLSTFCKDNDMNYSHMSKVANGKEEEYRGWKKLITSTNKTIVNQTTKEEIVVESASAIAKKIKVDQSHLAKLLAGKRDSCSGWEMKNRVIIHRPHKGGVYHLVSPDGENVKVNNLSRFAEERGLDATRLLDVINGKASHHKGWIRYGSTHEDVEAKKMERYYKTGKQYPAFIDPNGNEVDIFNMHRFCKENGLTKQNMLAVVKGKTKSHKGWTLKHISEHVTYTM